MVRMPVSSRKPLEKLDGYISSKPLWVRLLLLAILESAVFHFDSATGTQVSASLFYLFIIFLALRFVGSRFGYLIALVSSLGKLHLASVNWPHNLPPSVIAWKITTTLSLYMLFCYLLNSQISRLRRSERALDDLSQLHSSIISETESGILLFDAQGKCLTANQAAATIAGCSLQEIGNYNFLTDSSLMSLNLRTVVSDVLRTGQPQHIDSQLHTPFGRHIWCIASVRRITHQGRPCALVVFTDISDYKHTEQALIHAHAETSAAQRRAIQAERNIVNISEQTQQKIGQELHDNLGQHLTGIAFLSEVLFQKLKDYGYPDMATPARITQLVNEAIAKTRTLAHGLYPVELKESGLVTMLEKLADHIQTIYGIECHLICQGEWVSDAEENIHLFRIAQEAINNAIRHGAASRIAIQLTRSLQARTLEITDNGVGMQDSEKKDGIGLKTMRYRASLLAANCEILQPREGGTAVLINLPEQPAYA